MAEVKTRRTGKSVKAFIDSIDDPQKRADSRQLDRMLQKITGHKPAMWGSSIVGYGSYHYVYASGREGDSHLCGFSPRKQAMTLYIMSGFSGRETLLQKLGSHKTGKSCLYIKRLEDVDLDVLEQLIEQSVQYMREKYRAT